LGHAVAHGGHAACNLRCATGGLRRILDQLRETLERLMRRQHVVVGRDDPDIGRVRRRQRLFFVHRGIGMGLVAAGQMGTAGAFVGGPRHKVEIVPTGLFRAFADTVGYLGDGRIQGHVRPPGWLWHV